MLFSACNPKLLSYTSLLTLTLCSPFANSVAADVNEDEQGKSRAQYSLPRSKQGTLEGALALHKRAVVAHTNGSHQTALEALDEALALIEESEQKELAEELRAKCLFTRKDTEDAWLGTLTNDIPGIALLLKTGQAALTGAERAQAFVELGNFCIKNKRPRDGIISFGCALAFSELREDPWCTHLTLYNRALGHFAEGDYDSGIADTTAAIDQYYLAKGALKPLAGAKAHYQRGTALGSLQDYQGALIDFDVALALIEESEQQGLADETGSMCRFNRKEVEDKWLGSLMGDLPKVVDLLKTGQAALTGQKRARAFHDLGVACYKREMYENAKTSFSCALAISEGTYKYHTRFNRGKASDMLEHYDSALADFRAAQQTKDAKLLEMLEKSIKQTTRAKERSS